MVVVAILFARNTQVSMPVHPVLLPVVIPFHLLSRLNKELHFHLLKLLHPHDKLPRNNLISKCFTRLCDSKWQSHSTGFLDIQIVYKNPLCCFRSKINLTFPISCTHLCTIHQIELPHISPVLTPGYRASYTQVFNQFFDLMQFTRLQTFSESVVYLINFGVISLYVWVGRDKLFLIKILPKTLLRLCDFFCVFLPVFFLILLNQNIRTVTLFRVFVVNHWIVKPIHVTTRFPNLRVHKNGSIYSNNVFVK